VTYQDGLAKLGFDRPHPSYIQRGAFAYGVEDRLSPRRIPNGRRGLVVESGQDSNWLPSYYRSSSPDNRGGLERESERETESDLGYSWGASIA